MYYLTTVITFLLIMILIVGFHDLGHFLAAILLNVKVETASLGFGPRLFGKRIGITDFRVSAIPWGTYIWLMGESSYSLYLTPQDRLIAFSPKPLFKRIAIVVAGPIFSLLLSSLILFFIVYFWGMPILKATIGVVGVDSPAFEKKVHEMHPTGCLFLE